jgi:hypothetical protein
VNSNKWCVYGFKSTHISSFLAFIFSSFLSFQPRFCILYQH